MMMQITKKMRAAPEAAPDTSVGASLHANSPLKAALCTLQVCLHANPKRGLSLLLPLLMATSSVNAMVELKEEQMADVTGAGLAFVFDDFSLRMAPTSYAELTGDQPTGSAYGYGWRRGDARYYGISMTNGGYAGTDWYASSAAGAGCNSSGLYRSNLSCPMGTGDGDFGVTAFASVYDPFMLRVFEYEGYNYAGKWLDQPAGGVTEGPGASSMPSVLEFRGPANSDAWRWAFWGELEINRGGLGVDIDEGGPYTPTLNSGAFGACNKSVDGCEAGGAEFLQSQTIILGKPIASGKVWNRATNSYEEPENGPRRAVQRWMHTTHTNATERTFGVTYDSALSGDFRFSVRQNGDSPDALHDVPDFQDSEGMYFRKVDAFFPLGTLHYQALTFSGVTEYDEDGNKLTEPAQNGNFSIELTRIPGDVANIYNHFYCGRSDGSDCTLTPDTQVIANPNPDTHGYVRWGDWEGVNTTTGAGLPNATDRNNGIYFIGGGTPSVPEPDTVTNIGISRIEGMTIHHFKLTSLGAGT